MNKCFTSLLLIAILIGGCTPVTASTTQPPTASATPTITHPSSTSTATLDIPTILPLHTSTANFSISQIRMPSETDGREVLTAFWSQYGMAIYYALINEISDPPFWFQISLENGQFFQNVQLSSPPKLTYTPSLPVGGVYSEYQGLVSPSDRYKFQITQAENYSLYLLDSMEQSKAKLLETSDMNFREAYWMPGENKVVFGIGPEYGTELYLYDIGQRKLASFTELIGYADWNLTEWALSPDGKHIAILDDDQSLHIFSLDDSYSTIIPGYQNNVRWAGNSQRIYFYYGDQIYNPTNIGYFDMVTKVTTNMMLLSELEKLGVDIGFFDVSPDGTQLVFWQAGDIWLLSLYE